MGGQNPFAQLAQIPRGIGQGYNSLLGMVDPITKAQPGSPLTTPAPVGSNNWMVPPQFAGTTSAGASQGVSAYVPRETPPQPNIDELAMAFMQFGTPEQQAAGLRHLSSKDQWAQKLEYQENQFDRQLEKQKELYAFQQDYLRGQDDYIADPVVSRTTLNDGTIGVLHKSGKAVKMTIDGQVVEAFNQGRLVTRPDGSQYMVDDAIGSDTPPREITSPEAALAGAGQSKYMEQIGKERASAAQMLPGIENGAEEAIALIDRLIVHPGRAQSTGTLQGRTPTFRQEAVNFEADMDELQNKIFMAMRVALKGGGQITDFEGQKAQNALANLDLIRGDKDFVEKLKEARAAIVRSRNVARQVADGTFDYEGFFSTDRSTEPPPQFGSDEEMIEYWYQKAQGRGF